MLRFTTIAVALILGSGPAFAQTAQDAIVAQLKAQGFTKFEFERTWLGRVRIEAYSDTMERELVFNPNTGEVLRDYWEPLDEEERAKNASVEDPVDGDDDVEGDDDDDDEGADDDGSDDDDDADDD